MVCHTKYVTLNSLHYKVHIKTACTIQEIFLKIKFTEKCIKSMQIG